MALSGFLGTRLVEKLFVDMALNVRAAVHHPGAAARLARFPVQFVECDVLNPQQVEKAVAGCDIVINCTSGSDEVAVKGTLNLIESATRHHVKKYVHLSSAAVHGFSHRKSVVYETSRFVFFPRGYERGKIKSEKLVADHAQSLPSVILRPTLIYGPYSSSWTSGIISRIRDHQTTIVEGQGLANLIYVDDVVDAIIYSIKNDEANGEIFIVNNDQQNVSWAEYARAYAEPLGIMPVTSREYNPDLRRMKATFLMLRDSLNIMVNVLKSPQFLALLAQVPVFVKVGSMIIKGKRRETIETKVTSETRISPANPKILLDYEGTSKQFYKLLTCRATFSASKSRKVLHLEPLTPIEEGIARSIEWANWAGYYG